MIFADLNVAAVFLSYLLGSLPAGLLLGLWLRGVDIRKHGSQNIGATNTMRVLGKPLGIAALVFDVAKGLLAVLLFARMGTWEHLPLACGLAAILGHTYSVFLRFRGGKGVATSAGVFFGLIPVPMLIAAFVFAFVVGLTRMVSAGSMAAALALAMAVWPFPVSLPVKVVTTLVAALVLYKHQSNFQRILRGEENRL